MKCQELHQVESIFTSRTHKNESGLVNYLAVDKIMGIFSVIKKRYRIYGFIDDSDIL